MSPHLGGELDFPLEIVYRCLALESAIRRQISERVSGQTGALPRAGRQALADYGLSVIDLEEQATETVSDTRQQIEETAEVELDEDTVDEVYFRLKRILETESERMGGEA